MIQKSALSKLNFFHSILNAMRKGNQQVDSQIEFKKLNFLLPRKSEKRRDNFLFSNTIYGKGFAIEKKITIFYAVLYYAIILPSVFILSTT